MPRAALAAFLLLPSAAAAGDLETQAVALAGKLGGTAKVNDKLDDIATVAVKLPVGGDKALIALCKMPCVGSIEILDASACTEAGFAALRELPDLQMLSLFKSAMTEKKAAAIGTIRPLTDLYLGDSHMTDAAFAGLKKLANLKRLDVLDAAITNQSAAVLAGFKKLEELNLSGTKFGDAGVDQLHGLTGLKLLRLNKTNVTRKSIDAIEAAIGSTLTVRW